MIGSMVDQRANELELIIEPPENGLTKDVEARLRTELGECPDVAFAHLCQVIVIGQSSTPQLSVFVWLLPEAVGSLGAALNLVSEAVARALPEKVFLDVLILNSVPELLAQVEETNCLLVERDREERRRAREAATCEPEEPPPGSPRRGILP